MNGHTEETVPPQSNPPKRIVERRWFTADEIPQPPPEMRKPPNEPEEIEPSLFDDDE